MLSATSSMRTDCTLVYNDRFASRFCRFRASFILMRSRRILRLLPSLFGCCCLWLLASAAKYLSLKVLFWVSQKTFGNLPTPFYALHFFSGLCSLFVSHFSTWDCGVFFLVERSYFIFNVVLVVPLTVSLVWTARKLGTCSNFTR